MDNAWWIEQLGKSADEVGAGGTLDADAAQAAGGRETLMAATTTKEFVDAGTVLSAASFDGDSRACGGRERQVHGAPGRGEGGEGGGEGNGEGGKGGGGSGGAEVGERFGK